MQTDEGPPQLEVGPLVLARSIEGLDAAQSIAARCHDVCPVALMPTEYGDALVFSDVVSGDLTPTRWGVDNDVLWFVRVLTDGGLPPKAVYMAAETTDTKIRLLLAHRSVVADAGTGSLLGTLPSSDGEAQVWYGTLEIDDGAYQVIEIRPV